MMKGLSTFVIVLAGVSVWAQEPGAAAAAEMQAWMDYAKIGPQHERFAEQVGEWNMDMSWWMDPAAEPQKSKGTCVNKTIMGGRYMVSEVEGVSMGMPFTGQALMAYDNVKKKYYSTWIDSMGTGIVWSEGNWDKDKNAYVMEGKMTDPTTGGDIQTRMVTKVIDKDKHTMAMYMVVGGQEMKSMEIVYTRK